MKAFSGLTKAFYVIICNTEGEIINNPRHVLGAMISQYEDFFTLIDDEKVRSLVDHYQRTLTNRKFISTWKNFYDAKSEMMSYIGYYTEASDALIKKIIDCLQNYNGIRDQILGMMDVDSDGDITQVVESIRSTAKNIDRVHQEVEGESEDLEKLFWNIWQLFEPAFNIPGLPKIPRPLVKKSAASEESGS